MCTPLVLATALLVCIAAAVLGSRSLPIYCTSLPYLGFEFVFSSPETRSLSPNNRYTHLSTHPCALPHADASTVPSTVLNDLLPPDPIPLLFDVPIQHPGCYHHHTVFVALHVAPTASVPTHVAPTPRCRALLADPIATHTPFKNVQTPSHEIIGSTDRQTCWRPRSYGQSPVRAHRPPPSTGPPSRPSPSASCGY